MVLTPRTPRHSVSCHLTRWAKTTGVVLVLLVGATALLVGALWAIGEVVDDREVLLAATFVLGLAFLLAVISGIVATFAQLKLTDPKTALGLPEGSIRAIIALVLVLIFVLLAVYLMEAVFTADNTSEDARTAATQLLATVGTLVAAVAAFYFGTGAVTTGTDAATRVTAAAVGGGPQAPMAVTKGSDPEEKPGSWVLHGVVNAHGQNTDYCFEYGTKKGVYETKTVPQTVSGDQDRRVKSQPIPDTELKVGHFFRIAAWNDAGRTYGLDHPVGTGDAAEA